MEADNRRRIIEKVLNKEITLEEARAEANKAEAVLFHLIPPGEFGYYYGPGVPFQLDHTGERMTVEQWERISKKYGTAIVITGPEWTDD